MQLKKLAAATSKQNKPNPEWMSELAKSFLEAKSLFLYYQKPRLARRLSQFTPGSSLATPPTGEQLLLFKHPIPGEAQARLAYEYVFEKFTQFLEQRNFAVAESQSAGHLLLWFPEQKPADSSEWLEQEWSVFLAELTSSQGFRDSFALALNSSKLADGAGFSVLKTPIFNSQHAVSLETV
jgi:hypothetical protein